MVARAVIGEVHESEYNGDDEQYDPDDVNPAPSTWGDFAISHVHVLAAERRWGFVRHAPYGH
jgi:hypothetical protein